MKRSKQRTRRKRVYKGGGIFDRDPTKTAQSNVLRKIARSTTETLAEAFIAYKKDLALIDLDTATFRNHAVDLAIDKHFGQILAVLSEVERRNLMSSIPRVLSHTNIDTTKYYRVTPTTSGINPTPQTQIELNVNAQKMAEEQANPVDRLKDEMKTKVPAPVIHSVLSASLRRGGKRSVRKSRHAS